MNRRRLYVMTILIVVMALVTGCAVNNGNGNAAEEAATRDVVDATGATITIPNKPLRIADISGSTAELLILNIQPVATANTNPQDNNQIDSIILEQLNKDAIPVGYYIEGKVNLEKLASVNPDLILTNSRQATINEQVAKIAPTVVVKDDALSTDWRVRFQHIGEIFNREADVEKWFAAYDAKAADLHDQIVAKTKDETFGVIETGPMGYRIYANAGVGDILFNDVKLPIAEGTPKEGWGTSIQLEGITTIDPDHIILLYSDLIVDELDNSDVWKSLKAVRNGNVYRLANEVQYAEAFTTSGKLKLLDTFYELIVGTP
ncbi:ABC transporter substrate-binding protein [Paenibacillus sp. strain BS8-2]